VPTAFYSKIAPLRPYWLQIVRACEPAVVSVSSHLAQVLGRRIVVACEERRRCHRLPRTSSAKWELWTWEPVNFELGKLNSW